MSNGQLYRLFLYLKKLYSEGPPPGSIGGDIYIMWVPPVLKATAVT